MTRTASVTRTTGETAIELVKRGHRLVADDAVEIRKAPYQVSLVRIGQQNFFSAIRDKLMWGM